MFVVFYLVSVVVANTAILLFGQYASIITPLLVLSVTFVSRDILHHQWNGNIKKMLLLVGAGSVISYVVSLVVNPEMSIIAVASFIAFLVSESVDFSIYSVLPYSWYKKANISTSISSVFDSVLFVSIAFGFNWTIIAGQVLTKIIGSLVLSKIYEVYQEASQE